MFKVGDKVWCFFKNEWGKIIEVRTGNSYPIRVCFGNETEDYTIDGQYLDNKSRTLFFEEIPITTSALKRPRFRAKEGELYQFISRFGSIIPTIERESADDDALFKVGNYFETREEAEESEIYKAFEKLKTN